MQSHAPRRWPLLPAAILLQLGLGAVYAWSVFSAPLQRQFGWSSTEAVLPFQVAIGTIFIGAMVGGRLQDRFGPRPVALAGGALYSVGTMLASRVNAPDELWLLVLTAGAMAGLGMGAAYVTPIAMLAKWFPDKRGLVTGLAVGGFGFGAAIVAPAAQALMKPGDVTAAFLPLGLGYLVATVLGGAFFRNPPAGHAQPSPSPRDEPGRAAARQYTLREALRTKQFYLLTAILALGVTAGIALISQLSPAAQAITGTGPATAAMLVGLMGLLNGAGRIFWAALSDRLGRMTAFVAILLVLAVASVLLPHARAVPLFALLAGAIYLCYGGAFGVMPATAAETFGTTSGGAIYGAMIVAWSVGGVLGPLLTATLLESSGSFVLPFSVIGLIAGVGLLLPLAVKPPPDRACAVPSPVASPPAARPSRSAA